MLIEVSLVLFLILLYIHYIQKSQDAPPGPIAIPVLGNLIQIAVTNAKHSYIAFHELAKTYGDVMTVRLGSEDMVVLSSLKALQETLHKDEWSGRIWNEPLVVRSFNKRLGLIFLDGNKWKEQRSFTTRHLKDVGFGEHESMELLVQEELETLMSRMKRNMGDGHQVVLLMHNFFNLSVLNVLWQLIAGVRYDHNDENLKHLLQMLNDLFKSGSIGDGVANMFPFLLKIAPEYFGVHEQLRSYKSIHGFIRTSIADHRQSETYGSGNDFIDIYLQEIDRFKDDKNSLFNEEQLIVLCMDLFLTGSETTSNTLSFAILYMILYPHVQEKVYQEIQSTISRGSHLRLEDQSRLPYTEAVLMEVQRIANVAPLPPPHQLLEDVTVRNFKIRKDTIVFVNLYSVHMDKHYWEDPEVFRPERFLDSEGKVVKNENLLPFGIGKRTCLGESLARMSLFSYFTTLIQNFFFETVPGHLDPSTEPVPGFTLSPQQFHAVVTSRE